MEPRAIFGTTEEVSVKWLMNNLVYSADGYARSGEVDWESMIRSKAGDWSFPRLVKTVEERGFRVPICVYWCEDGWGLGNGHHRMTLAILTARNTVPVYWSDRDYMSTHRTDTEDLDHAPEEWIQSFCDFMEAEL